MSNVINWGEARKKIQDIKLQDFKKKQPHLSEYIAQRSQHVLLINTLASFVKNFEDEVLCFSDKEELALDSLMMYLTFKIFVTDLNLLLKQGDDEVKRNFPSFQPDN